MSPRPTESFASLFSSLVNLSIRGKAGSRFTVRLCETLHTSWYLCVLAVFLALASGYAGAQAIQPGTPNWGAFETHSIETINLATGNIVYSVPVRSKAGPIPLDISLVQNNSLPLNIGGTGWAPASQTGFPLSLITNGIIGQTPAYIGYDGTPSTYGWTTVTDATCPSAYGTGLATEYSGWYVQVGGTAHFLPATAVYWSGGNDTGCHEGFTATTIDGSGYTLTVSTNFDVTIYSSAGWNLSTLNIISDNQSTPNTIHTASDPYGIIDSLGITALSYGPGTTYPYTWTDVNGNTQKITYNTSNMDSYFLGSNFQCSGINDYQYTGTSTLPTELDFPDNTKILFSYEQTSGLTGYYTGRYASITLRSGGVVSYNYNPTSATHDGMNCTYGVPTEFTRTTSDGTTSYTIAWQTSGGSCTTTAACSTTTVIDPGGNETVYYFSAAWGTSNPVVLALTAVLKYQNIGTVGSPKYSTTPSDSTYIAYNSSSVVTNPTTYIQASVSLPIVYKTVYHTIGGGTSAIYSAQRSAFDGYGNVAGSYRYDFGATTPTFYSTTTTYGTSWNGSECIYMGTHVFNKTCEVTSYGGSSKLSDTRYMYDSYGNVQATSIWNGTSFIGQSSANTYNSNGTIATSYDLANNETTYAYNTGSYSDCVITCSTVNPFFPTTVTNVGTNLATLATWDINGGVALSSVGPNGAANQKTSFGYTNNCSGSADPFWRVGSVTDPNTNQGCQNYLDSSNEVQTLFSFNSGVSVNNATVKTDGYGRVINTQTQQGPSSSNFDTVTTSYIWSPTGSPGYFESFRSVPCTVVAGGTCTTGVNTLYDVLNRPIAVTEAGSNGVTTYTYDNVSGTTPPRLDILVTRGPAATWGPEHKKQVQNEYDGLGRLIISCGILSSGGSSCGEVNTASGVKTSYAYTAAPGSYEVQVTRGSQTKTTYSDAMGRTTQSISPDSGTWNYYYDSVSTPGCPSGYTGVIGKLEASKDPNSNLICYKYDSLGRVTGVNANNTTCRHFYYDTTYGTVPSGVTTPTNTLGRLAEASTDNCSGTIITDEWFSYDKDGNKTDLWETTPNAGRYFHSTSTFAGNGAVLTVDLNDPSEYTNTYTLDGKGRWTSLVNSHVPQTQVSSVVYNAASQPTQVNIGTGTDNDAYTYDPNTGRMTQWVFTVGSANQTGKLTWNPIGSLQTLAITDGFHSSGTQTCNMGNSTTAGYDDLGRLLMFDCGSGGWGQTFTYDNYDNLTKTVIPGRTGTTFNPTYNTNSGCSPCNNQYRMGYGASYDNDGNQLSDPSNMNTYTWNEFSKLASVDMSGTGCSTSGECIIYDAFGRIVEVDSGTTYTETFYTQAGKGIFHGAAKVTGLWPAPGAGIVSDTTAFMHQDWLGNVRLGHTISTSTVGFDQALTPYGEIYATSGSPLYGENNFSGDIQSIVSGAGGLWDTPNRELGTAPARWLSPDPAQSGWNPYAYATNPNSMIDPSGLGSCPAQYSSDPGCNVPTGGGSTYAGANGCPIGDNCQAGGMEFGNLSGDTYWSTDSIDNPTVTTTAENYFQGQLIGGINADGTQWWYATGPIFPTTLADGSVGFTATPWMPSGPRPGVTAGQLLLATLNSPIAALDNAACGDDGVCSAVLNTAVMVGAGTIGTFGATSDVADYSTYVIGNLSDTATWEGVPFANTLNVQNWDLSVNDAWVESGIENGNSFTIASPLNNGSFGNPTYGTSVYFREFNQVMNANYTFLSAEQGGGYAVLVP